MDDDLLPGGSAPKPPAPTPEPARESRRSSTITCQFCQCTLVAASGDFVRLSAEAKAFRDQAEQLEILSEELAASKARIQELERIQAEATRVTETPKIRRMFGS